MTDDALFPAEEGGMTVVGPGLGLGRTAYHGLVLTQRNVRRIFRAPRAIVFAVVQPLMFVLLFAYVFAGPFSRLYGGGYIEYLMAGVCGQSAVFGAIATSVGLAGDAKGGAMDRLRTLPIRGSSVLVGRTTADLVRTAFTVTVTTVVCLLLGWRVHASPAAVIGGYALLLLTGYTFTWIGALIGLRLANVESANTAGLLMTFPVVLLSGAFVPVRGRTGFLGTIAEWNPITATVTAMRAAFGNPNPIPKGSLPMTYPALTAVLWCLVLLLIFVPACLATFRGMAR
jgi:ABC-2 type transport system permease protein